MQNAHCSQTRWDPVPTGKIGQKIIPVDKNTLKLHLHLKKTTFPTGKTLDFSHSHWYVRALNKRFEIMIVVIYLFPLSCYPHWLEKILSESLRQGCVDCF